MNTIWSVSGSDINYEHFRLSPRSQEFREWCDQRYYSDDLRVYLDSDYLTQLRNSDFFGRVWELELAYRLHLTNLILVPTQGKGPDFCVELTGGVRVWIEAVRSKEAEELKTKWHEWLRNNQGQVHDTPSQDYALRYSTSLASKAKKIQSKYSALLSSKDFMLIGVSAFAPGPMDSNIEFFMRAVLPIGAPLVQFSLTDEPLDTEPKLPTHDVVTDFEKSNYSLVSKDFLYPGLEFPFIDGVVFSEASELQNLLGSYSSRFDESTARPHFFPNHAGKKLPSEFTSHFYYHEFSADNKMVGLVTIDPVD